MSTEVWSLLETENDQLNGLWERMAVESHRTAEILNGEPCVVICSEYSSKMVEALTPYGLKKIYFMAADLPATPDCLAMTLNLAVKKYNPEFLLFAATSRASEIAAKTAASLRKGLISNCVDFEVTDGNPIARKVVLNGKTHALYSWKSNPPYLATIDQSALEDLKTIKKTDPDQFTDCTRSGRI